MKYNNVILSTIVAVMTIFSTHANAFRVDKLVVISDNKGNGIVTLINDEPDTVFINAKVQEIEVINNGKDIRKKEYTRENLKDWKVALTHQKLILKPGEHKNVGIRSLCHNTSCDNSRDIMFLLPFSPSPYDENNELRSNVAVSFGFSPVYIIPTTNPIFDYDIKLVKNKLVVKNNSNTMINLFANTCKANQKNLSNCKRKFSIIAGREKTYNLPKEMLTDKFNVTVTSHDSKYEKKLTIKGGV